MNILVVWFTKLTALLVQHICFRTKVYYEDKKAQGRFIKGPAILISNHHTIIDYAVLLFVFYFNTLRVQMAEVLFKKPVLGVLLKLLGGIYVNRDGFDYSFVGESERILEKGGVVGIFPESRIPLPTEKKPIEFKASAAYIALKSGAKVVPVHLDGSYFNLKKRARVIIGKPIDVYQWYDPNKSHRENYIYIAEKLRQDNIRLGKLLKKKQEQEALRPPFYYALFNLIKISAIPSLLWFRPKRVCINKEANKKYKKGVLFFSNHTGMMDPPYIMLGIPYRDIHFVTLQEIHDNPRLAFLFKYGFRTIPIDRENMNYSSFKKVSSFLEAGAACCIFPEGQINVSEEEVQGFKNGMILMALKGKAPLVPLYVKARKHWWNRQILFQGEAIDIVAMYGATPSMDQIEEAGRLCHEKEMELAAFAEEYLNK